MNADSRNHVHRFPVGPAVVPHRKNAAEWVMWLAIVPVVLVLRAASFAPSRLRR